MQANIVEVTSDKQLKQFIHFQNHLYEGNPYYTPALESDEFDTLSPKRNPAFEFCSAKYWLAYDENGKIVGRIAGIVNPKANAKWGKNQIRFGWFDIVEDEELAATLLGKVAEWGKSQGLTQMIGPLGFTDMDKEGMLVEGFDRPCPFTTLYNHPYYPAIMEKIGFAKDIDWIQRSVHMPDTPEMQEKIDKIYKAADMVEQRYGLHIAESKSVKDIAKRYGHKIFEMYNDSYAELFEFTPLTDKQIDLMIKTFVPLMDKDFVSLLVDDDDNIQGFAFCTPSLTKAFQKNKGKLFPFGWIPLIKALKGKNDTLEALMIGLAPEAQNKGAFAPMFKHIHSNCVKRGIKTIMNNPQLEDNYKVINIFQNFNPEFYMRRRCYKKDI